MSITDFKDKLRANKEHIEFADTMEVIAQNFVFTPTAFTNGTLKNTKAQNLGSCKVFAFAIFLNLTKEETLACFGKYYFNDVLKVPNGIDHQNIRNFIKTGFQGLAFKTFPLEKIT